MRKVKRPRHARSSGAVASPQYTEGGGYVITVSTPGGPKPEDLEWDRLHFGKLASRRSPREQVRQRFIDKAERTPQRSRRWFRIKDIESDEAGRKKLLDHWRASIWHKDLMLGNKSQVLCLSASPLAESNRLPPEVARGEQFYGIIDDLWMSVPRWLQLFDRVEIEPPEWMSARQWLERFRQDGLDPPKWLESLQPGQAAGSDADTPRHPLPDKEPDAKALAQAYRLARRVWGAEGGPPRSLSWQKIADSLNERRVTRERTVTESTVRRLFLGK